MRLPFLVVALASLNLGAHMMPAWRLVTALPLSARERSMYAWLCSIGTPAIAATVANILGIIAAGLLSDIKLDPTTVIVWFLATWGMVGIAASAPVLAARFFNWRPSYPQSPSIVGLLATLPSLLAFFGIPDTQVWRPMLYLIIAVGLSATALLSAKPNLLAQSWPGSARTRPPKAITSKARPHAGFGLGWIQLLARQSSTALATMALGLLIVSLVGKSRMEAPFASIFAVTIVIASGTSALLPLINCLRAVRALPLQAASIAALLVVSTSAPILLCVTAVNAIAYFVFDTGVPILLSFTPLLIVPALLSVVALLRMGTSRENRQSINLVNMFVSMFLMIVLSHIHAISRSTQLVLLLLGFALCFVAFRWSRNEIVRGRHAYSWRHAEDGAL